MESELGGSGLQMKRDLRRATGQAEASGAAATYNATPCWNGSVFDVGMNRLMYDRLI